MNNFIYNTDTPILFLVFNRPETTLKVFNAIRNAKPKRLYISADGPRNVNEQEICNQVKRIVTKIDWECEVFTNFSDNNKGCKMALSDGITWFFNQEEEGIVLEDDCLPSASFFGFCSTLLAHYRYDTRITHIGGSNLQLGQKRGEGNYYFSNLTHVWGWAGWRRVWEKYDVNMETFPAFKEHNYIKNCQSHLPFKETWLNVLEKTYAGEIDTWDYQYAYLNLINNGLSVIPNFNLISNIGFGVEATHTTDHNHIFASLLNEEITSFIHPLIVLPEIEADIFTQVKESHIPPAKKNALSRFWKKLSSR